MQAPLGQYSGLQDNTCPTNEEVGSVELFLVCTRILKVLPSSVHVESLHVRGV
jgi:hypothetical protein